eukprot:m.23044 g.23044  ORF g.23044 m.23044 type:complete len:53 (+) comp28432_c0_seq6:647-805(+)
MLKWCIFSGKISREFSGWRQFRRIDGSFVNAVLALRLEKEKLISTTYYGRVG